jgi:endonuclease/exonuclease/phosphatase family metal-dependent hydrolase
MMHSLKLMTWNLWGRGGDWEARQATIDAALTAVRPDIVAIQETWYDGERWPQAERLAELLGDHYTATAAPRAPGDNGLAVLSRWPISSYRIHTLPVADNPPDDRIALDADIATPAGVLPVCTVHLSWPLDQSHVRQDQVRALVGIVASQEPSGRLPHVLCGDFNAEPASDEIRMLTGHTRVPVPRVVFQDSWQVGGDGSPGHTWSHQNPAAAQGRFGDCRLDYVFVRWAGYGAIVRAEVIEGRGPSGIWASDHFAILAELDLEALARTADDPGP